MFPLVTKPTPVGCCPPVAAALIRCCPNAKVRSRILTRGTVCHAMVLDFNKYDILHQRKGNSCSTPMLAPCCAGVSSWDSMLGSLTSLSGALVATPSSAMSTELRWNNDRTFEADRSLRIYHLDEMYYQAGRARYVPPLPAPRKGPQWGKTPKLNHFTRSFQTTRHPEAE